jgi:hypothetical protein
MHEVDRTARPPATADDAALLYKDAVLDRLSAVANVAQFVSFGPDLSQRYSRVCGHAANHAFDSPEAAIAALLAVAPEDSVNVRSFLPENPKSREFIYGLRTREQVLSEMHRLAAAGLFTIVNETIDVRDGGVSGVALGDVLEFAPEDTPRCVEKPGTVSLPRGLGVSLLETVYRFKPALDYAPGLRVEFSIHPLRRGFRREHTIVWELEEVGETNLVGSVRWPNRFSRFVGDKAFGLLIAEALGLPVPATTVIARKLSPFTFGQPTGTGETWIRTCPVEQDPGRFTTKRGWLDPFRLLHEEDAEGQKLASLLAQEGVEAVYSGAAVAAQDGTLTIEGVRGYGDDFMLGRAERESLPAGVIEAVRARYEQAALALGPVRLEWVYDGVRVWVVQFHRGATDTVGNVIYPGTTETFHRFEVAQGIDALRSLIAQVQGSGAGIRLIGNVGVTSHFGDLLRRAKIPSSIEPVAP